LLATLLVAAVAQAQSAPPAPRSSDSWSQPAPAATVSYREAARPKTTDSASSHFRFKDRRGYTPPPANAAQQHSGNAAVGAMGTDRNGRPAVNCPQTPMDPACH
jgi:hypothetical protein